ncbi:threonine ammonia-lyase IlvA [Priestia endophytica]|uniref:threonine ammonia-lyase IlvA n=1 Tax=Priestia endophytica TaxID=135735 RepID=UPI003D2BBBB3
MSQQVETKKNIHLEDVLIAHQTIKDVVDHTPLQKSDLLSERYECEVYLKREDLQNVRSFKIRGAYNKIKKLSKKERENGIVCASAGNHAQGVAYACQHLKIDGKIFMPATTPKQKINRVTFLGKEFVEVVLTGDTFDDAYTKAAECGTEEGRTFIHPFDDPDVIAGQGTVAVEMLNDTEKDFDYVFASIGGGGLISGIGTYIKSVSPQTRIVGVEPAGAPSMHEALKKGSVQTLQHIDGFVDGAAVKTVGCLPFHICQQVIDDIVVVPEGKVCTTILSLYNENAIVAEPAGALSIAALDTYKDQIKGKTIVCIVSGGNNDIGRMQEIKERSKLYEGLQHYFIVNFPQRAGALREFLDEVLGPTDDITRFEYTKKNNRESGPAFVGIEVKHKEDYFPLIERMNQKAFPFTEINKDSQLFHLFV